MAHEGMARSKVFISYSREDERWRQALRVRLAPFEREGRLDVWDDTRIAPGSLWQDEIVRVLDATKVGVLLVSADFLASEFISREEVPRLLAAAASAGGRLLCVYVRPSSVDLAAYTYIDPTTGATWPRRLTDFKGLNDPGAPLSSLTEHGQEAALVEIARTILAAAEAEPLPPSPPPVDPRPYLERLRDATRWLDVRGIGGATGAERVELERVYTRLRVVGPSGAGEGDLSGKRGAAKEPHALTSELRMRDVELRDLLAEHPHLVLVGDPGAGKTTFLRFVALNLARALLDEERDACLERIGLKRSSLSRNHEGQALAEGKGLAAPGERPSPYPSPRSAGRGERAEPPFPIFVRLADFGRFLATPSSAELQVDCAEQFYRFLDQPARGLPTGLPPAFLRDRLLRGGCLLLLDGLDEVPGQQTRERVGAILEEVVAEGRARGNRHVVTCRTRAYQGRVRLGAEFTRATLVDFGPDEVETFVRQWSRALFRAAPGEPEPVAEEAAEAHRLELVAAIRAHPHVRPLTANPLLLTILAVVHWNRKKLPEQRADLYEAAVEYLLDARVKQSLYDGTRRKHCLQALALRLFTDPGGVRKTLSRREAAEVVGPLLGVDLVAADAFIEDEELHSGILVSRNEGEVEFWHLTFGEYLAALELAWQRDCWERVRPHVFDPGWSEVVLLLAGCLWRQGPGLVPELIRNILALDASLAGRARQVGLIGRILRDIQVRATGGDPAHGTGYAEARRQVLAIFERGSEIAEDVRIEVGEALGQAGDPRISDDDHANRVFISGGTFWMGAQKSDPQKPGYDPDCDDDEAPVHRVTLTDFWIDRYPVTVQQFQRFVEAGAEGYLDARFWRPEGWRWREAAKCMRPDEWEEQTRHPNRPVTRVRWHEADAYCAWLANRTGRAVSLPTEAQWEHAARGTQGRKHPWGADEPTEQHANFNMRVVRPTPVGIYPLGATPEGVHDLAGNVSEWCLDCWADAYPAEEQIDPRGPEDGASRLRRGGGFYSNSRYCRAACRRSRAPEIDGDDVGFRCVVMGGRTE